MKCAQYHIGVVTSRTCSHHSLSVKFSTAMDSSKMYYVDRVKVEDETPPPRSPEGAESAGAIRDGTGGLPLDDAKKTEPVGNVHSCLPVFSTFAGGDRGGTGAAIDDETSKFIAALTGRSQSRRDASASSDTQVNKDEGLPSAPPAEEEAQQRAPRSSASNGAM